MLSRASLFCRRPTSTRRPAAAAAATTVSKCLRQRRNNNNANNSFFSTINQYHTRSSSLCTPYNINSISSNPRLPSIASGPITTSPTTPSSHQQQFLPSSHHQKTQTRTFAGRKDRASTSFETRQPTPKQRKKYHRRRRAAEYEVTKHSPPNSKAVHRRQEQKENTERLLEIAHEEEALKKQLSAYYDTVNSLQAKIENSPKFQTLLKEGTIPPHQIKKAAREAAKTAAEKSSTPHPPLPTWWQDRMTYDWGDALVDDLMGNSADLTSGPSPYPVYMGGEYGRLSRKVERIVRLEREEERVLMLERGSGGAQRKEEGSRGDSPSGIPALGMTDDELVASSSDARKKQQDQKLPNINNNRSSSGNNNTQLSDKLLSDLLRSHRDANGKRTSPIGLGPTLELLHELQIPLSKLGTYSHVSLLTCCKSPWEGRKVNDIRKEYDLRSNEYFWSALVDVYARSGDYRGAEGVLDEMLEESQLEHDREEQSQSSTMNNKGRRPISIPPLPAYTSFFSSCHTLISRPDVHPSIKSDAADRAWARWKEMRIHSVAPDVMAYGALMRVFAAQGRAEKALDLLDEIMTQMMMPVSAGDVLMNGINGGDGGMSLGGMNGDENNGWYDDQHGNTIRVKPTTLLFTSALQAVSKSHEIATKFNGGKSKKNRRRESITSYHGRLTQKIVILAEQAEVRQDDGFVAALMRCAAAAGDSSTARAIFLASKVRRMDHLRTCGGKDHLNRLQGLIPEGGKGGGGSLLLGQGDNDGGATSALMGGNNNNNTSPALRSIEEEFVEDHEAYEHREYGNDTRILSTLLLAHSKAMESKGLGSMWSGRYNRGYLCSNSLRYIEAYNRPQMENMAIPGLDSVKAGLAPEGWQAEEFDDDNGKSSKQLRKKHKFQIKSIMDDGYGNRREEMDDFFDGYDPDPDDLRRQEMDLLNGVDQNGSTMIGAGEGVDGSRDWLNDQLFDKDDRMVDFSSPEDGVTTANFQPEEAAAVVNDGGAMSRMNDKRAEYSNDFDSDSDDDDDDDEEEMYGFDAPQSDRDALVQAMAEATNDHKLAEDLIPNDVNLSPPKGGANINDDDDDEDFDPEAYFDEDEFNKLMSDTMEGMDDTKGGDAEELDNIPGVSTNDFAAFRAHLAEELRAEGSSHNVDDTEARQLFDMMRTYYDEGGESNNPSIPDADFEDSAVVKGEKMFADKPFESTESSFTSSIKNAVNNSFDAPLQPERQRISPSMDMSSKTMYADDYIEWAKTQTNESTIEGINIAYSTTEISAVESPRSPAGVSLPRQHLSPLDLEEEDPHITELQQTLPGLSMNRIEKVSDEFSRTLGYPSILRLTLAVREVMPEAFSPQCLTRKNLANAKHVISEAEKEGMVDAHLLNGMLRVHTNSGRIEPALRFYDTEYKKHGMAPTTHSDRLLFEMLVNKKRISRAFKLKQDIERDGRSLDLLSYGTLVEHFGNHKQLGSALLLIKECASVHGSPPGEKSLKNIRLMCRQRGLIEQVGLEKMIGKDPLEWMRRGEELKRVQNKRGKSSALQYGMNRMVDI
ncbi:hypothetical protein ACHAXR_013184 [Thalassiosira sp. AJA248-18]